MHMYGIILARMLQHLVFLQTIHFCAFVHAANHSPITLEPLLRQDKNQYQS